VRQADAGIKVTLVYWFVRKGMAKMTGRAPAAGRSGIEPIEIWAHQPKLLSGFSDEELLALPRYRQSDLFTAREKLALDYTVAAMRTPVEVTDELVARMKEHFSDEQLVEITALLTVLNLDRFNAAFGIGSAGFSEGMVCVPPDRPPANPALARIA
jgi:hypothetical protein